MEGDPVSAKICLAGIFSELATIPPQFLWDVLRKSPFPEFSHLRRKSLFGSKILKAIVITEIITITSVV